MGINLLNIEPHKVSKDLSGYITYIYGAPKTGKTTLAVQMPKTLLLAFERGYNALPGVIAQDVTSWGDMKQVMRELKKPEVKANFDAVVVDTIDIASDFCQKYICQQTGIEALGDLGYGKGWTAFKDEFNNVFRGLTQLGYAVFFIGHHKEQTITNDDGTERIVIRPALSNSTRQVIEGMADIYGYAHQSNKNEMSVLTLRCPDDSISCGGRFKYIASEFPMSYDNLVEEIHKAIDKEALEHGNQYVTDEREKPVEKEELNYDALMNKFQELVGNLMQASEANGPKITKIIDKYLGKGRKIADATPEQVEMINLIVTEIEDELMHS